MRPPSKGWTRELQVGMFVLTAMMIIAAFSFRITDSPIFRRGKVLTLYMNDATGIFKNSKVKMAGIDIGAITKISLEEGRARIDIVVDRGIEIPKNAKVIPRPLGILGDKYLEVVIPKEGESSDETDGDQSSSSPSSRLEKFFRKFFPDAHAQSPQPKSQTHEVYKEGEVIRSVETATTLDDITKKLGEVSQDIKVISTDLRKIVGTNKDKIGNSIESLNRILRKIDNSLAGLDEKKFNQGLNDLSKSTQKLAQSFERIENITRKVDEGEGTVGKLINDTETVDQINRTLTTVNAAIDRASRTQIFVDMNTEYNAMPSTSKTSVALQIFPREDSAYLGGLVIDESGAVEKKIEKETVNGGTPTVTETETTKPYKYRVSLQYFKRISHIGFRVGIFESSGGAAVDFFALRNHLKLSIEAFDFTRDNNNLQLRAFADLVFLRHFYLRLGGNELASTQKGKKERSFMAGIGLRFSDSDLKALFALPGIP